MAISIQPRRGCSSRRQKRARISEINVTPMVDVMLVLLIIFMVTAPLLTTGVNIDLPRATADALDQDNQALTVSVAADGRIFLQETPVEPAVLIARLAAVTQANPEARIYVRGDAAIAYGRVMEVMGLLKSAGFAKVALVTQPGQTTPPAPSGAGREDRAR